MSFEIAHQIWIQQQAEQRSGESLRRLREGHGHAEKLFLRNVWWPSFGHFHHLFAEYGVTDFKDGMRYLDFAYIVSCIMLAIEIDGFSAHSRDLNRWQFSDQLRRQNDLVIDGWRILRFSYDDVQHHPKLCQLKIQQFMGRWTGHEQTVAELTWIEKEVVRFAIRKAKPVTPNELCAHLNVESKYARKLLRSLVEKKWLKARSGDKRIRSYEVNLHGKSFLL